jgi:hypothetical protein
MEVYYGKENDLKTRNMEAEKQARSIVIILQCFDSKFLIAFPNFGKRVTKFTWECKGSVR